MADKCIGKLTLDISDVEKKVKDINEFLAKIGTSVNIGDRVSKSIKKALNELVDEAKKAGAEAQKALAQQRPNEEQAAISKLISLYKDLYNARANAVKSKGSGDFLNVDFFNKKAEEAARNIDLIVKKWNTIKPGSGDALAETATSSKQVLQAVEKLTVAENKLMATALNRGIKESEANEKAAATAEKAAAKQAEAAAKAEARIQTQGEVDALKNVSDQLDRTIALYKQYYEFKSQAATAGASGNTANEQMYTQMARSIQAEISAIQELNPWLTQTAEKTEEVVAAQTKWQAASNTAHLKETNAAAQETNNAIKEYATSLVALYNEQSKLNNALATGKINEGSQEYQAATEKIRNMEGAVAEAGSKLDAEGIKMANSMQNVRKAVDDLIQSQAKMADSQSAPAVDRLQAAYNNLTTAVRNYREAERNKNEAGVQYWQNQINGANATIASIENEVKTLSVDEATRQRILNLLQQSKDAQYQLTSGTLNGADASSEMANQVSGMLTRYLSIVAVIRTINSLIKSTTEYVSEYYDKMNEIRIITGHTEAEAEKLGQTYRNLAREMSVSSLDMADAAIYFTRQGLGAAEVEKRLQSTTRYAKAANIEFETAAELITAVVNSMDLAEQEAEDGRNAAERVADVFLKVGDNAATSGEEIGVAMQKASAAAGSFGFEFEWLAAYIATVSETTRQEATSIGTAFNTLIARLHSIRSTGYNSEDETKINDIQKALNNINVALMDQDGNWRDMVDIFNDVADVWDTLDGKTRSYIATTMAGVKQQNVFLALMEDLSQKTEGTSRAWELHELAVNSAGTAQEKYATYTESVTAAQERLTVAQEQFYSLLSADVIKGWYNSLADIVNMINNGAAAMDGWNIKLPILVGGIAAVVAMLKNIDVVLTIVEKHPVMITIGLITAGVTSLIGVLSWLGDVIDTQSEKYERASDRLNESMEKLRSYNNLKNSSAELFEGLESGAITANNGLSKYNETLDRLAKLSPEAKKAVDDLRSGFGDQKDAVETLNNELEKSIELQARLSQINLRDKYASWSGGERGYLYRAVNADYNPDNYKHLGYGEGYRPWDPSMFESMDNFSTGIRQMWEIRGGSALFGQEARDYIKEQLEDLRDIAYDDRWEIIGQRFWEKFFGGGDMKDVTDVMKNEVDEMISEVISSAGIDLDSVGTGVLRQRLVDAIFGEDGELNAEEYSNAGKVISNMMVDILSNGFELTDDETLRYIGSQIFGDSFKRMFGDDFDDIISNNPDLVENISSAYQELLAAGFDNADLNYLLEGVPIEQWGDMVQLMKDDLLGSLGELYGDDLKNLFGDAWEDLDFETISLVNSLAQLDTPIEDILNAAQGADSLEELTENLRNLYRSVASPEESGEALVDYAKDIKKFSSEIKSIDTVLDKIADKKVVGINDIFDIANAHPEIWQFIKDADSLSEALMTLREQIKQDAKASVKESILNNEGYFTGTEYFQELDEEEQKNIRTMKDYLEYIGEEDEEYQKITQDIDATTEAMMHFDDQTSDTANTLQAAASEVKAYSGEIKSIDSILDKMKQGKSVNINDIFSLATSYPELLKYTDSIEGLDAALLKLRGDIQDKASASIRNAILDSSEYFTGTDYYANLNDSQRASVTTMREYLALLDQESDEYKQVTASIDSTVAGLVNMQFAENNSESATEDLIKEIKSATQEMDKLDKMIQSLDKDGTIDFSDLLNLAAAHPEIIGTIHDINSLRAALLNLKKEDTKGIVTNLKGMITSSKEAMEASPFAGATWIDENGVEHAAETMQEIIDHADQMEADMIASLNNYLDQAVITFLASTNQLSAVSKDVLGQWMENLFPESNIDLLNRKAVQLGDDIATVLTETITASADGREGIQWNQDIICNFTPITPDGELLDEDTFHRYIDNLFAQSQSIEDLWENDKVENGGKGLLISADIDFASFEEGIANAENLTELLHLLQEAYYGVDEANKTWLETQLEQAEQNEENSWAKTNGYIEQLGQIQYQLENFGAQAAIDYFYSLDETMRKGLTSTYPGVLKSLAEMEKALKDDTDRTRDLTKETNALNKELQKSKDYANTKYFTETSKAIKGLEEGTVSATDAYSTFYKECDKVTKAQEDVADVTTKMAKGTAVTVSDVSNLANVLGMTAEEIISDFPGAVDIFNELIGAGGDLEAMFYRLNEAAFIRITGTSECDFSELQNGLLSVQDLSRETIELLQATGQWELETLTLPQEGYVFDPKTGKWNKRTINAHQTVLKPTGNNPFKSRSSTKGTSSGSGKRSGGGGGGGRSSGSDGNSSSSSSSTNEMTEIERMLDLMSQISAIQDSQRAFYQAQQKYYQQTGQLMMVIAYMQKEKEVLEGQNKTLQDNVSAIEAQLGAKQAEVAAMDTSAEGYKEAADDLDKLQKAHQQYTKEIIENKTAIEALNEGMKEQQRKIRDMEIDLRNTILKAIEDREAKIQRMLSGEIEMENIIMDLIKQRYEKERDQIIDTTNLKINSLQEERDLLSEQLQLRKQQEEEEDKLKELTALEEKYAKISADPTRQKEALSIRQQINKLRKEMAWDTAEKEVQAQQDSIDQQINSLEDYINYVEDYYEDLFEHPQKLIEEMRSIITKTDAEIIEWLKANSEEFMNSTENSQRQMILGWEETLRDMRGQLKLYWDEVEDIIAQGDEYIIEFLKANSADYAAAGKLQAEAFVDEWQDKLDKLKKAHETTALQIAASYEAIRAAAASAGVNTYDDSSSGGGGGGGGGGSGDEGTLSNAAKSASSGFKKGATTVADTFISIFGNNNNNNTKPGGGDEISNNKKKSGTSAGGCFAPGTQIRMANGEMKNIELVKIGDLVIAYNEETRCFEPRMVTKAYVHHDTPRMIQVSFYDGTKLCITPGHPILTENGWKSRDIENSKWEHNTDATWMEVGENAIGLFENLAIIDIQEMKIGEHYDSYNIEVETLHTFLACDIVVHNAKVHYATGGIADFNGPAWLDGSPQLPERVLSPFQTQLFETMVQALEQMNRVTISSMPNFDGTRNAAGNLVEVGDIIVNVENLDTDDDYETMAERVSEILMERIGRTTVVGGLRINSL